ncbi:hypothetical protein ACTQ1N_04080 [Porcincola sp. LCP21S3_C12]|uniref:hypothetical protein n=1 Tax=Porcincola sp. LCP21S3_C12 TaxID=3438798 RepID=UPI003F99B24D
MKKMIQKLKSKNGESIGEVLAAMVIISLAAIMLASMIAASMRIITRSVKGYDLYVAQVNALNTEGRVKSAGEKEYPDDELGYQRETGKNVIVVWKVGSEGQTVRLSVPVTIYEIRKSGSTELWRYQAG